MGGPTPRRTSMDTLAGYPSVEASFDCLGAVMSPVQGAAKQTFREEKPLEGAPLHRWYGTSGDARGCSGRRRATGTGTSFDQSCRPVRSFTGTKPPPCPPARPAERHPSSLAHRSRRLYDHLSSDAHPRSARFVTACEWCYTGCALRTTGRLVPNRTIEVHRSDVLPPCDSRRAFVVTFHVRCQHRRTPCGNPRPSP